MAGVIVLWIDRNRGVGRLQAHPKRVSFGRSASGGKLCLASGRHTTEQTGTRQRKHRRISGSLKKLAVVEVGFLKG